MLNIDSSISDKLLWCWECDTDLIWRTKIKMAAITRIFLGIPLEDLMYIWTIYPGTILGMLSVSQEKTGKSDLVIHDRQYRQNVLFAITITNMMNY